MSGALQCHQSCKTILMPYDSGDDEFRLPRTCDEMEVAVQGRIARGGALDG